MGGGEHQDFPSKIFCLTVPKYFVGQSFSVAIISGIEKVWIRRGASRFSVENFLSHSAEKFCRAILHCCNNFGYRKNLDERGEYQDFPWKSFCLTVPKRFVGQFLTVAIISGIEKVWIRGGGHQVFPSKIFLSHSAKKFRRGTLLCRVSEKFRKRKVYG